MRALRRLLAQGANGRVTSIEVREKVFERMRRDYFATNPYAQAYLRSVGGDASKMPSDHTAIRLSNIKAFREADKFLRALSMEAHTGGDEKFAQILREAQVSGDFQALYKKGVKWPLIFPDKALSSTYYEDPEMKGIEQKIFISILDPNAFPEDVRALIYQDWEMFSNDFSAQGQALINKLESEGSLSEAEADLLVNDWIEVFSTRQIPMMASTFDAIKNAKMVGVEKSFPAIPAIGAAFSGRRNHHTPMVGYEIAGLPQKLEEIGVPPGSPPVQYDGPIVQTSSQGIPQIMELLDDSSDENKEKIAKILKLDLSYDEKRKMLQDASLIIERTVNHEYVEYIKRAQMAVVNLDGEEVIMPVWQFEDGRTVSARSVDQDRDGLLEGKYPNGFDSYQREVKVERFLFDKLKRPVLAPGFTANNATNIFLGTSLNEESQATRWSKEHYKVGTKGYNIKYAILATVEGEIQPVFVDEKGEYYSTKRDEPQNLMPLPAESVEEVCDENRSPILAEGFSANHELPKVNEITKIAGEQVHRVQMALLVENSLPSLPPTRAIPVFVTEGGAYYSARAIDKLKPIDKDQLTLCNHVDDVNPLLAQGFAVNPPSQSIRATSSIRASQDPNAHGPNIGMF